MLRKITALILTAVLLLAAAVPALAATDAEISAVKDFKFFHFEKGIGRGLCPVYTAPDADAFRIDGAQCQTNADMSVAGVDAAGWLLVRYTTNDGAERIGWIPPEYAKAFQMDGFDYVRENLNSRVVCTAQEDLAVTDDLMGASTFATIPAGETYAILATYTYENDWWYVEFTLNGQTARGLIDRESTVIPTDEGTYDVHSPAQSPLGTVRTGWVTVLEDATLVRRDADPEAEMTGRVNAGAEYACYAEKTGTTGSPWYYIYIYDQNAWGWIAGQRVSVKE